MLTINSESTMFMNGLPVAVFSAMQNHLLEKAEQSFNRSAGCESEWTDEYGSHFVGRMYLDLSYDDKDFGRIYTIEVQKNNDKYHNSTITYYGGAKRPKDYFGKPQRSINMITKYKGK